MNFVQQTILMIVIGICLHITSVTAGRLIYRIQDQHDVVPVPVNKCRSTCLAQFLPKGYGNSVVPVADQCTMTADCFMCWDFCRFLHQAKRKTAKDMCTNLTCFSGCKYACAFHSYLPWNNILQTDGAEPPEDYKNIDEKR